jgi:peptidoglycan/LPS O-acetylase OafA/YrhL
LAVVAFHLAFLTEAFHAGWFGTALLQLNVGVWIFFVLSGFLLYTPFARAHAGGSRVSIGAYARRRALRIYPAYWVVLLLVPWLLTPSWRFTSWASAIRAALLVDSYTHPHIPTSPGLPQAWSLVVEVSFYAFLPVYAMLIAALARRRSQPRVEWTGLVVLAVIGVLATAWPGNGAPLGVRVLPQYLTPFVVGMAAAVARTQGRRWPRPGPWIATGFAAWCAVVVVSVVGHSPSGLWWNVFAPLAFTVAAGGLVVPLIDPGAPGRVASVARSRPMVALGRISYGIFLWHYGVIVWVTNHWFDPQGSFTLEKTALVVVPFTVLAAWLTFFVVERPAMALGRGQVRSMRRR